MRILYGIQSTGNGHITRSSKIIQKLSREGCWVDILISGNNSQVNIPFPIKYNLRGLTFYYGGNGKIDYWKTFNELRIFKFLKDLKLDLSNYDLIISDFEPITAWASKLQEKYSIGIANQYSFLSENTPRIKNKDFLSEMILKWMAPVNKPIGLHFKRYDSFIKYPVLRDSLYTSDPKNGGHYTVYLSNWNLQLMLKHMKKIDCKFEIFSEVKKPIRYQNCFVKPINKVEFDSSLINSRGVITAAGFQTCAESIFLNKDLIVIPIENQYEQLCNAESLKQMGMKVGNIDLLETMMNLGQKYINENWIDPTPEIVKEVLNFRIK